MEGYVMKVFLTYKGFKHYTDDDHLLGVFSTFDKAVAYTLNQFKSSDSNFEECPLELLEEWDDDPFEDSGRKLMKVWEDEFEDQYFIEEVEIDKPWHSLARKDTL